MQSRQVPTHANLPPAHRPVTLCRALAREIVLEDTVSTELLAPGDLTRPMAIIARDVSVETFLLADGRTDIMGLDGA